jgi:anti-anti-sigma regulatory factor
MNNKQIEIIEEDEAITIALSGSFHLSQAEGLLEELKNIYVASNSFRIILKEIETMDLSMIQILESFIRTCEKNGKNAVMENCPETVEKLRLIK